MLVADKLHARSEDQPLIERLASYGMTCQVWDTMLARAEAQWSDFLNVLTGRTPTDERVLALRPPAA
jgi:hypothetical protein